MAAGGGGGGVVTTVTVSVPWTFSVFPSASVAVAVAVNTAASGLVGGVPAVAIPRVLGLAGSGATENTAGSEEVSDRPLKVALDVLPEASNGVTVKPRT